MSPPSIPNLFPEREPIVRFPVVEDAVEVLRVSPAAAGHNYHATAEAVREGAFAITGDLTNETVADIRKVLADNIAQGPDREAFVKEVKELFTEGTGLSDARIDMVFRNNVGQALSDGAERSLSNRIVVDAFPYREAFPTHDDRVRQDHLEIAKSGLDGTAVYNRLDPVWATFRGPWDYNCRCSWRPVTVRQAAAQGIREAKDWLDRAEAEADALGGTAEEYLEQVSPVSPEFVSWPVLQGERIEPSPGFRRSEPVTL